MKKRDEREKIGYRWLIHALLVWLSLKNLQRHIVTTILVFSDTIRFFFLLGLLGLGWASVERNNKLFVVPWQCASSSVLLLHITLSVCSSLQRKTIKKDKYGEWFQREFPTAVALPFLFLLFHVFEQGKSTLFSFRVFHPSFASVWFPLHSFHPLFPLLCSPLGEPERAHTLELNYFFLYWRLFVVAQHPMAHTNLSDSDTALCVRGSCCWEVEHWWTQEREKGGSNGSVNRIFSLFNGNLMNYSDTRTAVALLYEWMISRRILFILFLFCCFLFFLASSPNAI